MFRFLSPMRWCLVLLGTLFLIFGLRETENLAKRLRLLGRKPLDDPLLQPFFMPDSEWRQLAVSRAGSGRRMAKLFPEEKPGSNRVIEQNMFIPRTGNSSNAKKKVIYVYKTIGDWQDWKFNKTCLVDTCILTVDEKMAGEADAVIFNAGLPPGEKAPWERPPHQLWIMFFLESPYHTPGIKFGHQINWTITYRWDSDVMYPYYYWAYYDPDVKRQPPGSPAAAINWAANKTKQVAWMVSNCNHRNGRKKYVEELSKHISVDVYGRCGTKSCPLSDVNACFAMLKKDYKFYLAFENSNCRDYITEKFFNTSLGHNLLPIVMGAPPEDYKKMAPLGSYIHVDEFATPRDLAAYLHKLDKDDKLYNEYFQWKGTGQMVETRMMCRLCAMLHDPDMPRKNYANFMQWWNGPDICISNSWREHRAKQAAAKNTTLLQKRPPK